MYHPNNLRRGPRPPLLRTPLRMGYEVNLVLSRANNEVHTFKRQLEDQKLAYNRLVSELSDQKTQNQQLLEDNHQLDFKVTEMEDELAHYEAVNTGLYKRTNLNETKISNLEHKISVLSSRNVVLEDERQQHQLSKVLEADNIRLTSERDSLAALIKFQEQTHRTEVAASESTKLALVSKVKEMEDLIAITEHEFEQERIVLEDICLEFKRKKLGFFGRRMQDRQTEISKLKH